jgi:hypothetical protein
MEKENTVALRRQHHRTRRQVSLHDAAVEGSRVLRDEHANGLQVDVLFVVLGQVGAQLLGQVHAAF